MGLDQYLYKLKTDITPKEYQEKKNKITDKYGAFTYNSEQLINSLNKQINKIEIGYWRKYYKLDEYCQVLYRTINNNEDDFNCEYLELSKEHIKHIINICSEDNYTVNLMNECLDLIKQGYKIWYSNWW